MRESRSRKKRAPRARPKTTPRIPAVANEVRMVKVADLTPYEKNPRKNDHAVAKMVRQIQEFGFRVPILAKSTGEVCDGHLRLKAAKAAGLAEVPVILVDDLSDQQISALRISINQSAAWAEWDSALLVEEITALQISDFDISLLGFTDAELENLTRDDDETQTVADEDGAQSKRTPQLRFGDKTVPLSQAELDALTQRLEIYVDEAGSNFGFVTHLLATA